MRELFRVVFSQGDTTEERLRSSLKEVFTALTHQNNAFEVGRGNLCG